MPTSWPFRLALAAALLFLSIFLASSVIEFEAQATNSVVIYGLNAGSGSVLLERLSIAGAKPLAWRTSTRWSTHNVSIQSLLPRLERGPATPGTTRASYTDILIPLWIPFALSALPASLLYRKHRRALRTPAACPHCNYNLTGLAPNSPCPECGRRR